MTTWVKSTGTMHLSNLFQPKISPAWGETANKIDCDCDIVMLCVIALISNTKLCLCVIALKTERNYAELSHGKIVD